MKQSFVPHLQELLRLFYSFGPVLLLFGKLEALLDAQEEELFLCTCHMSSHFNRYGPACFMCNTGTSPTCRTCRRLERYPGSLVDGPSRPAERSVHASSTWPKPLTSLRRKGPGGAAERFSKHQESHKGMPIGGLGESPLSTH